MILSILHDYTIKIVRRILLYSYKGRFHAVGSNVIFDILTSTFSFQSISLGDNVYIGSNAFFSFSHGKIKIDDNVMFGPGVKILGGNHKFDLDTPMFFQHKTEEDDDGSIIIENDVWIGANVIILPNVRIGEGCIVGAGSVVTRDLSKFSIYAGNPCKFLRKR
jgi:acetyltransferase-like isoleucine patch superfamily enzyme